MMEVLLITNSQDLTADYVIDKYSYKISFFRLNTDRFSDYNIIITEKGTFISYKDLAFEINANNCDALYFRKISLPSLKDYDQEYRGLMQREILTVIDGIAEIAGNVALTRPSVLRRADNKIVQLKIAQDLEFNLPNSLISNANSAANKFCLKYTESIVKPLSVGRLVGQNKLSFIQTNIVDIEKEISELDLSPCYFQQYIKKDYEIRLTVVDGNFFGVKIDSSNKIDWRKRDAEIIYTRIDIPLDIKNKCLKMMEYFDIKFAAFDFIVYRGRYFFLELNANGQWLWLEEELGLDISNSIVNYLAGERVNNVR